MVVLQWKKIPQNEFKYRQQFFIRCWETKLLIAKDRNRVRWLVLVLLQDGACMDLYENHSENSLKGDPSNDTTVNPPLFSLVNTFNEDFYLPLYLPLFFSSNMTFSCKDSSLSSLYVLSNVFHFRSL